MKTEEARKIAEETRASYDKTVPEFSASRAKFWEELVFLAQHIISGDKVLDIGCGNGRFFPIVEAHGGTYTGIDYSEGLIREARRLHPRGVFIAGDATALPFPDAHFDVAYSFAVIHHMPGNEFRKQFVREARRVLRPNGLLVLTAWDLWSPRHVGTLLANALKNILWFAPGNIKDVFFTLGKNRAPRHLHAFTKGELASLLAHNGFSVLRADTVARPSGEKNIVLVTQRSEA